MTDSSHAPCANCGAELAGDYCSRCGQHSASVRVSIGTLAHDFLTEHVGLDTKIPRSLWRLVRYPGRLTTEYLAGRRARYVLPLKLYLSASVVFFLILAFTGRSVSMAKVGITASEKAELDSVRTAFGVDSVTIDTAARAARGASSRRRAPGLVSLVTKRAAERFKGKTPQEAAAIVVEGFKKYLPNMIFAMLPVFAFILYVLYRRSGRFYAEHLIFAFHFHAFVFVALTLMVLAPSIIQQAFALWVFVYLFVAMRRVYGESRLRTTAKFAATAVIYIVGLFIASFAVLAGVVIWG